MYYFHKAVVCQKQISVEGNGHCCHRPSSNWETNRESVSWVDSYIFGVSGLDEGSRQCSHCIKMINPRWGIENTHDLERKPKEWQHWKWATLMVGRCR